MKKLPNVRTMYVPADDYQFIELDYSAAELHMIRCVARDTVLGQMLDAGDVHTETAKAWFANIDYKALGLPPPNTWTKKTCPARLRHCAKTIRFGRNYGAGHDTIWVQAVKQLPDITLAETVHLCNQYDALHKEGVVRYWEEEMQRVLRVGYSETRIMHRRRVYPARPDRSDVANYPIQGTVADMVNSAAVGPLHSGGDPLVVGLPRFGARIVLQVHDAFVIECPKEAVAECRDYATQVMEGPWNIDGHGSYKFPVESEVSDRWAA